MTLLVYVDFSLGVPSSDDDSGIDCESSESSEEEEEEEELKWTLRDFLPLHAEAPRK